MTRLVADSQLDMYTFLTNATLLGLFEAADVMVHTATTFQIKDVEDTQEVLTLTGNFGGYNGGLYPTTGTITGGSYAPGNTGFSAFSFSNASLSVEAFTGYVNSDDIIGLFSQVLQGADQIIGSSLADVLYGFAGNDSIDGGLGNDVMLGGTGNDTYLVNATGDLVFEDPGEGTDLVTASATYTLGADIENLTLTGSAAINGTGNALANAITGNGADNVLSGAAGNDSLLAGGGNDRLDGGTGADTMSGGLGNDIFYVDNAGDQVIENVGEGADLVVSSIGYTLAGNADNLQLSGSANINGLGNALNNIVLGNIGANYLYGLDGNDTVQGDAGNDRLYGGSGSDRLYGGTGNDIYYVDTLGDAIVEAVGEGTDLVVSTVSVTVGANIENLTLDGTAAIDGTGSADANVIQGNGAANIIAGMGGNDVLKGNGGNDRVDGGAGNDKVLGGVGTDDLNGGTGADLFLFDDGDFGGMSGSTADEILDFSQAEQDRIDLSAVDANSALAGDQAFTFIGSDSFHNVAGELRYINSGGNSWVYGDTDGDGLADFLIRVDGTHTFVASDFGL